jgi:hypothetical protein
MLNLLPLSVPTLAIVGGVLLLLWSQKDRFTALLGKLRPAPKAEINLTPHELFDRLYALRAWCEAVGQTEAVGALDSSVLPAIVRGNAVVKGGPKS